MAKADSAEGYIHHLETHTFPAIRSLPGFVSASILRRPGSNGVEFLVVTHWESIESIRAFAGAEVETAVVPPEVQEMMLTYDRTVRHYDVIT